MKSKLRRLPLTIMSLCFSTIVLAGCSKALTESSSVGVAQRYIDAQSNGIVNTLAYPLTSRIGVQMTQRCSFAGVQRLLKAGYLQEKTSTIRYPNFSGEFRCINERLNSGGVLGESVRTDTLNLQMRADQRPPMVYGTFRDCTPSQISAVSGSCAFGTVRGTVAQTGSGPSHLLFDQTAHWIIAYQAGIDADPTRFAEDSPFNRNISFNISLVRGNPDQIIGDHGGWPMRLQGHAEPDIQQEVYSYVWTDKLPKDAFNGPSLRLGHLEVDTCDHLLLASETTATASCKTHVKLNATARDVFGDRSTDQVMQVSFGKQPNGTWVCTNLNYAAPPYDITQ